LSAFGWGGVTSLVFSLLRAVFFPRNRGCFCRVFPLPGLGFCGFVFSPVSCLSLFPPLVKFWVVAPGEAILAHHQGPLQGSLLSSFFLIPPPGWGRPCFSLVPPLVGFLPFSPRYSLHLSAVRFFRWMGCFFCLPVDASPRSFLWFWIFSLPLPVFSVLMTVFIGRGPGFPRYHCLSR